MLVRRSVWWLTVLLVIPGQCLADDTAAAAMSAAPQISVYRDASCGCCSKWVQHLRRHGFSIDDHVVTDMQSVKSRYQVPPHLASCHTAVIDGYVIEGHVPADDILSLIRERPAVAGLSVPGMPAGSPGMEMPGRSDPYAVYSFGRDGSAEIYDLYPATGAQ